jgi:hypothetical protein
MNDKEGGDYKAAMIHKTVNNLTRYHMCGVIGEIFITL